MVVIMLSGHRQLKSFFLVERSLITWLRNLLYLQTLNLLIGEPKMRKLGVVCGITWSLRSVLVWFSYQLLNLFGNKPRNFTLVLTIWSGFMIFIKIISPWVCEELNIYQSIFSDDKIMKKQRDSMQVARFLSGLPKSLNPVKSQILASPDLPSLSEVFGRLWQATLSNLSTNHFSSSNTFWW